jgi:hypothetical protein
MAEEGAGMALSEKIALGAMAVNGSLDKLQVAGRPGRRTPAALPRSLPPVASHAIGFAESCGCS